MLAVFIVISFMKYSQIGQKSGIEGVVKFPFFFLNFDTNNYKALPNLLLMHALIAI